MNKTSEELESMSLGELIYYADACGCELKVMNDLVTKKEVIDAIIAHQAIPWKDGTSSER